MINRLIAVAMAAAFVVGMAWLVVSMWNDRQESAAKARLSTNQAQAVSESAKDAINATGVAHERETATTKTGDDHAAAIDAAPGANAPIDPELNRVGRRGLCEYAVNRRKPECLRQHPAANVEGGR